MLCEIDPLMKSDKDIILKLLEEHNIHANIIEIRHLNCNKRTRIQTNGELGDDITPAGRIRQGDRISFLFNPIRSGGFCLDVDISRVQQFFLLKSFQDDSMINMIDIRLVKKYCYTRRFLKIVKKNVSSALFSFMT